jgi:hypothetical protein
MFGLFEPITTNGQTLVINLTELLDNYSLRRKKIAYVKNEGYNVNIMITTLKSIVSCDMLGLEEFILAHLL